MTPVNPKDQAAKHERKVRLDLLDLDALREVARVMEFGAITKGYGVQNYAVAPISLRTYIGATLRHVGDSQAGEDVAPDSELDHWAHIAANAMIVLKAKLAGVLIDDRGPGPVGPNPINDAVREREREHPVYTVEVGEHGAARAVRVGCIGCDDGACPGIAGCEGKAPDPTPYQRAVAAMERARAEEDVEMNPFRLRASDVAPPYVDPELMKQLADAGHEAHPFIYGRPDDAEESDEERCGCYPFVCVSGCPRGGS